MKLEKIKNFIIGHKTVFIVTLAVLLTVCVGVFAFVKINQEDIKEEPSSVIGLISTDTITSETASEESTSSNTEVNKQSNISSTTSVVPDNAIPSESTNPKEPVVSKPIATNPPVNTVSESSKTTIETPPADITPNTTSDVTSNTASDTTSDTASDATSNSTNPTNTTWDDYTNHNPCPYCGKKLYDIRNIEDCKKYENDENYCDGSCHIIFH